MRHYSAREVSVATGWCVETVRRAWRKGELETVKSPSGYFKTVREDALERWVMDRAVRGHVPPASLASPSQPTPLLNTRPKRR